MTKHATYKELLALERDVNLRSSTSPAFVAFNAHKIKHFFSQNRVQLAIADRELKRIYNEFIQVDFEGIYKKISVEGDQDKWDFKNKGDEEKFWEAYNQMVKKPCTINL